MPAAPGGGWGGGGREHGGGLEALQQQDPEVEQVVISSEFAVAYVMALEGTDPGWRKANIEGPVYLVRRSRSPWYRLIVKNRLNQSADLCDDLHPDWELDCQTNYIFYKVGDAAERIRGLWFHEDSERVRVEGALERALWETRHEQPPPGRAYEPQVEPPPRAQQGRAPPAGAARAAPPGAGGAVGASASAVRAALHALAEDDDFVAMFMQKLRAG